MWKKLIYILLALFVAYFINENNKECSDRAAEMLMWLWENKEKII